MAAALSTGGGCPAAVRFAATSALMQLSAKRHPVLTLVKPVYQPRNFHHRTPTGAGYQEQIGEVGQFPAVGSFTDGFLCVCQEFTRHNFHFLC
jgi:hypothetical protein